MTRLPKPRIVDEDGFEPIRPAVRVFTVAHDQTPGADPAKKRPPKRRPRRAEEHTLVFDCETTTDRSQRLLFGSFAHFLDRSGDIPASRCVMEGLFYADDLPTTHPDAYMALVDYAKTNKARTGPGRATGLLLLSRSEFVERYIYRIGYLQRAAIAGFNLPFDLTRIALGCGHGRGRNRGGFSLWLFEWEGGENRFRPRITIRNIDGQKALIAFTRTRDSIQHDHGNFIDCRTTAAAYTDRTGLTLEAACEAFGIEFTKQPQEHGVVTEKYITYCRDDVKATARLYRALCEEHALHPIDRRLSTIFSAASVGKGYWAAMGIEPTDIRHPGFPHDVCGLGMEAFYGGRAECGIRNVDVPITYVDFMSMYMTCNVLMRTWQLLTAEHLRLDNLTQEVQELIADPGLEQRCFDRADIWPLLHTLVQVDPNGARFPVRTRYRPYRDDYSSGLNPFRSPDRRFWYPLGDVIAATLLDGPDPIVHKAFRLAGEGTNPNLKPLSLQGEIDFDPRTEDLFKAAVEQRRTVKADKSRPKAERERLSQFLKVMANSIGYGILVQLDRDDHHNKAVPITVYGGDGTGYETTTHRPERPGAYCLPPVAAAITGAARLMLTLLDVTVQRAGGTFAFCDTDSMAIVSTKTGQPPTNHPTEISVLSRPHVDKIIARFEQLNPYNPDLVAGSILEIEDENYTANGRRRELRCFAISAKRYQLTDNRGVSVKPSEHALGYLRNPTGGTTRDFTNAAWAYVRNPNDNDADWLNLPAVTRVSVSSPEALHWFAKINADLPFVDQVKPANFLLVAYPDPLDPAAATGVHPVAAFSSDPGEWENLQWVNRRSGEPVTIRTQPLDGTRRHWTVRVLTYRDLLDKFRQHPEAPATGPDHQHVTATTTGQLMPRPTACTSAVAYIGKESNDLHNRTTGLGDGEHLARYNHPDEDWQQNTLPTLREIGSRTISQRTGIHIRTVQRALARSTQPRPAVLHRLVELATETSHGH